MYLCVCMYIYNISLDYYVINNYTYAYYLMQHTQTHTNRSIKKHEYKRVV